jgi:hypothetical protein
MQNKTVTQYSVALKNEPGTLHKMTQILYKEDINISGITTESLGDVTFVRFMCREPKVKKLLEKAHHEVFDNPAFEVELPNQPGALNRLAKELADKEINILNVYGTANGGTTGKVVLAVDKPEEAQALLEEYEPAASSR